jgi:hypothetical protein
MGWAVVCTMPNCGWNRKWGALTHYEQEKDHANPSLCRSQYKADMNSAGRHIPVPAGLVTHWVGNPDCPPL